MIYNILTFGLYTLIYSISIFLFSIADRTQKSIKQKSIIFIGILTLAVFSSLRNFEIGTDTNRTLTEYYYAANSYSSISSIIYSDLASSKILFIIISKIITMLGLGERTFLLVMELLVISPIAVVAYIRKDNNSIASSMMFFLLLYFQLSFNWIRQCISASFLILAICLLFIKKNKYGLLFLVISVMFHTSALIGIILFIASWFSSNSESKYFRLFLMFVTVMITAIAMSKWEYIALYLIKNQILPVSYKGYVNVFSGGHGQSFLGWFIIGNRTYVEYLLRILLFIIPSLVATYTNRDKLYSDLKYKKEFHLFKMCSFLSLLIYSAGLIVLHTAYVNRITCYLDFANFIYLGFTCRNNANRRRFVLTYSELCAVSLCIMYNIWLYYVLGWHATVPFYF